MKTITLTDEDFKEISTTAAAELCAALHDPALPIVTALLLAKITADLFADENLIIDEEEE